MRIRALWIAVALCVLGTAGYVSLRTKPVPATVSAAGPAQAGSRTPERVLSPRSDTTTQHAVPSRGSIDAALRPPVPKSPGVQLTGTVKLNIKPWGTVYVDGVSKGASPPLKKLMLSEGHHKIQIMNPNFPSHTIQIEISNKKASSIEYDFLTLKK